MTYQDWRLWLKELPWSLKWFVLLVLFRPVIDAGHALKQVSPLLSPLYIVGVLTPVFILLSLFSPSIRRPKYTIIDWLMGAWGVIMFYNAVAILLNGITQRNLEITLKLLLPLFLYFYCRSFVRSRRDLLGILTTFLYATTFPILVLIYERMFGPIQDVYVSRGYGRYSGLYADIMNYAIYSIGAFFIASFFSLQLRVKKFTVATVRFLAYFGIVILAAISIHHTSTWFVLVAILLLFAINTTTKGQGALFVVFVVAIGVSYVTIGSGIQQQFSSMISNEVAVLQGEVEVERAFHGRMTRWQRHVEHWSEFPVVGWLFGISPFAIRTEGGMLMGSHNDYLRITFSTGLVGLSLYLLAYVIIFFSAIRRPNSERFLIHGATAMVALWSVSTVVTLYAPLMYLIFPILCYAQLPRRLY